MMEETHEVSAQVVVDSLTGEMAHTHQRGTFSFDKARKMRRDTVISLARRVAIAGVQLSSWTIEADEEWEWLRQFIEDEVLPIRTHLLRSAISGLIDFGWRAYEKVFEFRDSLDYSSLNEFGDAVPPTLLCIDRVRPLKNDYTWVRYDKWTGRFMGLVHIDQYNGQKLFIDAPHSLFVNFDEEGLGEYGESDMAMVEPHYDSWEDCNNANKRYDRKMSGSFLTVKYKVGKTMYNGKMTDNGAIAKDIINAMQSSGSVAIPMTQDRIASGNNADWSEMWKLEFLNGAAQQADFVQRLMYLDKLKARGLKVTERSVFEGEFGTKADAASHMDAMLMIHHMRHCGVVDLLNWHLVNQLCIANAGPEAEGAVKIVAHELSDKNRALFTKIFETLLADPGKGVEMLERIDEDEVMKSLEIPLSQNNELNMIPQPEATGDDWRDDIFVGTGAGITDEDDARMIEPLPPWWAPDVKFSSEEPEDRSCVMVMLPESFRPNIEEFQSKISKKDLVELETEPHITIKYGLLTNSPGEIDRVLGDSSPVRFELGPTRVFRNEDADVLVVDVWSECLRKLNAKLVGALPFTDEYLVYSPHMTIAYLKPGTGKTYEGLNAFAGVNIITDKLLFSDKNRKATEIFLRGDTPEGLRLAFGPGAGPGDNSCASSEGGGSGGSDSPKTASAPRAPKGRSKVTIQKAAKVLAAKGYKMSMGRHDLKTGTTYYQVEKGGKSEIMSAQDILNLMK